MSDHYRALTREYRPRTFEDIVAQDHVSSTLRNAVNSGRLAHAYLFCGPRGVGKTTMARVLARVINNVDDDVDSEQLASTLNIFEMDAASNNGVDDVRNLRESVRVPPQSGRYKVYIIDEVHMLSKQAWNAFLKTLEEPPAHAIFIFATTEPNKLLPTILSRVQRFDFRRIRVDEIVDRVRKICVKENITVDDESLHLIARKADGGLRDALSMMDQAIAFCGTTITYADLMRALNTIGSDVMFSLVEIVSRRDAHAGLQYLNDLIMQGYDLQEFLVELLEHLRNLFLSKNPSSANLIEATEGTRLRYQNQSVGFSEEDLLRMMHTISEAQLRLRDAAQPRILFELAILKLLQMPKVDALKTLLAELDATRKVLNGKQLPSFLQAAPQASVASVVPPPPISRTPEPVSVPTSPAKSAEKVVPPVVEEQWSAEPEERDDDEVESLETPVFVEPPKPISTPKPVSTQVASPPPAVSAPIAPARPPEPDMFSLFDAPAIRKTENNAGSNIVSMPGMGSISMVGSLALSAPAPVKLVSLSEIMSRWEAFAKSVEMKMGASLSLVLQRCRPVEYEDRRVILECEDDFYQHSIEEHKSELQNLLKNFFGATMGLGFRLAARAGREAPREDNYSQFQLLRDENPRVRMLVELFGAEPEY